VSEERDPLAPRTENERRALQLFDTTHHLAYAGDLSEEDLQRALARRTSSTGLGSERETSYDSLLKG
jgi:hypothetical protein